MNHCLNPIKYGFYENNIEYLSKSVNITNWEYINYNI